MSSIGKTVISLNPLGLDTKADQKTGKLGGMAIGDNVQVTRSAGGGVEIRKRFGFTPLPVAILGGGNISNCVTGSDYGDEIVLCDALKLYSFSSVLQKWVARGRFQSIACDLTNISGREDQLFDIGNGILTAAAPMTDIAYAGGYTCHSVSFSGPGIGSDLNARVYVRDNTSAAIVGSFDITAEYNVRLCSISTFFFVFSTDLSGKIKARKIDTATPSTISASVDVATDANNAGIFDAFTDPTNGVMWVAYQNTTPTLTIKSWTTANAVGVSSTYAGINPKYAIGFLKHDFSDSRGYIGVGALNVATREVRVVEFNTASGAETADTLSMSLGATNTPSLIVGYRAASTNNVFWYENFHTSLPENTLYGRSASTTFLVMQGAGAIGRMFTQGGKWYMPVGLGTGVSSRALLLELDQNTTGTNGTISIAGMFQNQDANGPGSLPSSTVSPSSGVWLTSLASDQNRPLSFDSGNSEHYAYLMARLDFSGAGLGKPIMYNGVLHLPSMAHKTYDGKSVVEAGFYADGPELTSSISDVNLGAGDYMTPLGTYQYRATVARIDRAGRISRSAPGPITTWTLGGQGDPDANSIDASVYCFPWTENDPKYNEDQSVARLRIEIWRTESDLEVFYLNQVIENDVTAGSINFSDSMSDESLREGEELYTISGELDNEKPPAVKALAAWQTRLFALTGEASGAVWHTKESAEGFAAEFSDEFRILTEDAGGKPVGLGSIDATFVLFKGERTYVMQGPGPDDKGAGPFPAPQALGADLGIVGPNAAVDTPNGILCQTSKGLFTLTRAIAFESQGGPDGYFSGLTVTGGINLKSRSMSIFVTTDRALCLEWDYGVWSSWTKATAGLSGVACARWRGQTVIFRADGTVHAEVENQYFDGTSTAINEKVEFNYIDAKNARVYVLSFTGDWPATTTLSETVTFDYDTATAETKTKAVTAAEKNALPVVPSRGRFKALTVALQETSTTEGFRLSGVDIEIGNKTGLKKSPASRKFS